LNGVPQEQDDRKLEKLDRRLEKGSAFVKKRGLRQAELFIEHQLREEAEAERRRQVVFILRLWGLRGYQLFASKTQRDICCSTS
jgi:hypothetical protein